MTFPLILLHLAPRLYVTRVVVVSCVCLMIYPLIWTPSWLFSVITATTAVHHTICLMVSFRFFFGLLDFLLIMAELFNFTCLSFFATTLFNATIPERALTLSLLLWMVWSCLILLTIFRIAKIIDSRGRAFIEPFNILPSRYPKERIPHPFKMLFGRSLWSAHFLGETRLVRGLRGLLGFAFFAAIIFWVFKNVLYEPITETALGPVREFRTRTSANEGAPQDFLDHIDPTVWNIIIPAANHTSVRADFNSSFRVDAVWTNAILNVTNAQNCKRTENPLVLLGDAYKNLIFFQFLCEPVVYDGVVFLPDLEVTVNFTVIDEIIASVWSFSPQVSVPISIGLTNSHGTKSIEDIFARKPPISLIPGMNIVAPYKIQARQLFTHRALAALGIFQKTRTFLEPEIQGFYPDPTVSDDRRGPNFATLRVYCAHDWSDTRVIMDQRMNSVISGFSDVGGLWTALNGIFAFIFGASLLHILYDKKILSIFGVAHSFHHRRMKDEVLRQYPNIVREHRDIEQRGLLTLVKDHLIDLSFLDKEISYRESPAGKKVRVDEEIHLGTLQALAEAPLQTSENVKLTVQNSFTGHKIDDDKAENDPPLEYVPLMIAERPSK
ncbi:hypothetical protein D9619_009884 [Psilocybe cf. subviscida]|uniref:Uncharacterized protein n=1 Tax=Psilocybe cf. subviscida TaxID=2480587 RepID=A0A8H5F6E6_9AGAR|nr:hypothetical protein D9619_009884 [Psilocybe cf. subviscida]